ncbi:uncharacterized protein METZ01_LOCUS107078 [marine metagenome]|uniref:Uncharacterized protein n=1 Tax=marine metagenome TaxID=408172 RepID=A0A381WNZ0_9ZZZZ
MATVLDHTSPIRRHQKVVATVDLPGVPEGTLGKVRVANGFAWYRYWVDFENGVELGHVDHGNLVKAGDWVRFQVERADASLQASEEVDHSDGDDGDDGGETAENRFGVPEYILERSREARARLGT